jgi:hypothetical protein
MNDDEHHHDRVVEIFYRPELLPDQICIDCLVIRHFICVTFQHLEIHTLAILN